MKPTYEDHPLFALSLWPLCLCLFLLIFSLFEAASQVTK